MKIDHKESFQDFGEQFSVDNQYDGYLGSRELLRKIVDPFDLNLIEDKDIMEVGVGSGRICHNLLKYKPGSITGIEPSYAKYFTKNELENELRNCGFKIEKLSNRLGYSYTAICKK